VSTRARHGQLALIIAGILVAAYLTLLHYDTRIPLVCSDHGFVDCQSVLSSPESTWFGLPVSLFGLFWFVSYGVLVIFRPKALWVGRSLAMVGAATVLYLVYVEFVVLGTVCLWCSSLHVLILTLLVIELVQWATWQDRTAEAEFSMVPKRISGRKSSGHGESL